MSVKITIANWRPVAKGRPRTGNGRTYTPPKTRQAEELVAQYGRIAMAGRPPIDGPLQIDIVFYFPIPKRTKKSDIPFFVGAPKIGVPDVDNLCKTCFDALNGIVYRDDNQICRITASKVYDLEPGCVITVEDYEL